MRKGRAVATWWYRVSENILGWNDTEIEIGKVSVNRATAHFLYIGILGGKEKREAITTTWYRTFRARDEAVRRVEYLVSRRIVRARDKQEQAIHEEREAIEMLAKWRRDEGIEPAPGTVGGIKEREERNE